MRTCRTLPNRHGPGMRCSEPWWRLSEALDGQEPPMSATTVPPFEPAEVAWRMNPSKASVVKAVGRRMVPYLIEATLIPTALFYVFLITFELKWAIVAALGWTYAAMGRRMVTGRAISGLLVLATLGISVRT